LLADKPEMSEDFVHDTDDLHRERRLVVQQATTETITIYEAATRLGVSLPTAYRAAARGDLPAIRCGARVLVIRKLFEQMLAGEATRHQL